MSPPADSLTRRAKSASQLQGTVAAGLLRGLFAYAVERGADPARLAAEAGVSPDDFPALDDRAPFASYAAVTGAAKRLTGEPALSLRFGAEVSMTELSALAFAAPAPADPRDTLALLNRFGRLAADVGPAGAARFQLQRRGGALWLCDLRPDPNAFPDLTESTFARMAANARRRGIDHPVRAVEVTHAKPGHHAEYARVFASPVNFGAPMNAMQVDERMLSTPSPAGRDYAQQVLAAHAQTLVQALDRSAGVRGQVEAELSRSGAPAALTLGAVAERLGMSGRTLSRRLAGEGTGFDQLVDGLRRERALRHLLEERRSVAETAHLAGFSDRAAFTRAFKRWTGRTPAEARG